MTQVQVLTTHDTEAWREALPIGASVMGCLEHVRIQERSCGHEARLFVVGGPERRIAYPFFLRPVPPGSGLGGFDTYTPEYTGPLLLGTDGPDPELAAAFNEAFEAHSAADGIIAEFAHLNPWNPGNQVLPADNVEMNREIVYVDLTLGEEALWNTSLTSDTRRQTRQSIQAGVQVRAAVTTEDVLAFHQLHRLTMDRRSASERYYLPADYFLEIHRTMPDNAVIMLSEFEGRVVAGGLYFQDDQDVYWHLSALDMDFSKVRPVNAYHFACIKACALAGRRRMLCGGAHQPGDGVFRFKAGFSPNRVAFHICKRIHDTARYAAEVEAWSLRRGSAEAPGAFFPAYRAD